MSTPHYASIEPYEIPECPKCKRDGYVDYLSDGRYRCTNCRIKFAFWRTADAPPIERTAVPVPGAQPIERAAVSGGVGREATP